MSLLETYKQEIRTVMPPAIQRDEWRYTRYGLLTATKEMTNSAMSIINDDLKQKALASEGRDLGIPVMKMGDMVIKNQRSCTIGDFDNETEIITLTWSTLVLDIHMVKSQYAKNELSYLQDLNKKLEKADHTFAKAVEDLIYAKLDTEKSPIYASPLVPTKYPLVGDAMQVAVVQQDKFFNDLEVIMQGDDFYSMPFKVLGSTTLQADVNDYGNQGANNDENTAFQFGGFDFRFSNHLVTATRATGFCMTDGSIGILTRINQDSVDGNITTDGTEWSITSMPTFGFDVGVQYKSTCTDLSGVAGLEHLEATMVERWQFSVDVAIVTPYNSDPATKAGVIKKFEFI